MRGLQAVLVIGLTLVVLSACHGAETYEFVGQLGESGLDRGQLVDPGGVAVDRSGNVLVSQGSGLNSIHIHKFKTDGTFVRRWGPTGSDDKEFHWPQHVAVDALGNVYVADTLNDRIQKFDTDGNFLGKWGFSGSADGQFSDPTGVAVAPSGTVVYVVDKYNRRVQTFTSDGEFIAKWGSQGSGDGQFSLPIDIAADASGNLYVTDMFRNVVQKFGSSGNFITKWGSQGSGDGEFSGPNGVATDAEGNVYVTESNAHRVQKFTSNGTFITKWGSSGTGDGQLRWPKGIDVDALGNVYVADSGNSRIQVFALKGAPRDPPALSWASTTGYTDDGVRPNRGQPDSTEFAFRVKITDASGGPLTNRKVVIKQLDCGAVWTTHRSLRLTRKSGGLETGAIYHAATTLPNGVYRYRFTVENAYGAATGAPTQWQVGPKPLGPPMLCWSDKKGYKTDGVNPNSGPVGTVFIFKVLYMDGAGDAPRRKKLLIRRNGGLWRSFEVRGVSGGDRRTGNTYRKDVTIDKPGRYAYRFEFYDATGPATGEPTTWRTIGDIASGSVLQLAGLSAVPTAAGAQVTFGMSADATVTARVLNIAGRPVKTICTARECEAGANTLLWNATSDAGLQAPSGQYLVEITAATEDGQSAKALTRVTLQR